MAERGRCAAALQQRHCCTVHGVSWLCRSTKDSCLFECAHKHPRNCQIRNHKVLRRIILMSMVAPWRWLRCSLCELGLVDDGGRATGQLALIPDTQCLTLHRQSVSKCIFAFQSCELEVGFIKLSRPFDRIITNFVFHRRQAIHVHCCQFTDVLHESFSAPVRVACGDKARISCAAYLLNLYGICFCSLRIAIMRSNLPPLHGEPLSVLKSQAGCTIFIQR